MKSIFNREYTLKERIINYFKFKAIRFWEFFYLDTKRFIKNTWRFRRELTEFRPWDYSGTLKMLRRSIQLQEGWMSRHSDEWGPMLNKKLYYMRRSKYLLDSIIDEVDFTELAEKRLNIKYTSGNHDFKKLEDGNYEFISNLTQEESENNYLIYLEKAKIEKEILGELFEILKGDTHHYDLMVQMDKPYEEFHSGKGLINWWN